MDLLTFQTYNCEGMFLDWSDPSTGTAGLSSTVVQYDYDMFIEKGSDLNTALVSLQHQLLRYVGQEVFSDCSRRLAAIEMERQLDEVAIKEISSAPQDTISSSSSCKIEDAALTTETECYPVTGYITAYYPSSGDVDADEASMYQTVTSSVESAMDESVLVTDTTHAVYYLGDRDTFAFDSAESYLGGQTGNTTSWWMIIVGTGVGLMVAVAFAAILFKKKRSSKKDGDDSVVVECFENESPPTELDNDVLEDPETGDATEQEMVVDKTPSKDFDYTQADCTMPSGCSILEVFGDK